MTNLNLDFHDILSSFNAERVEYMVVVERALLAFGAPADQLRSDFGSDDLILQLDVPAGRVDVITSIESVSFDEAWPNRIVVELDVISVPVRGREELLRNKRAVGRPQDQADVARLEAQLRGARNP